MSILDKEKLAKAESPTEFMRIIHEAPDGMIIGKKLKKNGVEIKYEYSEKMKELFEFHGINIDEEYKSILDDLGNENND
jgi:hypothetical protein